MFDILSFLGLRPATTPNPRPKAQKVRASVPGRVQTSTGVKRGPRIMGPDLIGLVGFNDQGFVISPLASISSPILLERVRSMEGRIQGMHTNVSDGLQKAVNLLRNTPSGMLRRIWLLSDGRPNPDNAQEREKIMRIVRQAREHWININTIGFGESRNFDIGLLSRIASGTHNGRYVAVKTPRKLAMALSHTPRRGLITKAHRAEATIYAIDCSGSMVLESMEARTKISVVKDTLAQLIYHKQSMFS